MHGVCGKIEDPRSNSSRASTIPGLTAIVFRRALSELTLALLDDEAKLGFGGGVETDGGIGAVLDHAAGLEAVEAGGEAFELEAAFFVGAGGGEWLGLTGEKDLDEHGFDGGADVGFAGPAGEGGTDGFLRGFFVGDGVFDLRTFRAGEVGRKGRISFGWCDLDVVEGGVVAGVGLSFNAYPLTSQKVNFADEVAG